MKILVIDEEFPWPLNNGKRTRSFSLTRALARDADVLYLAYGDRNSEAVRAMEAEAIRCVAVAPPDRRQSGPRFYLRLLANLFSPLPYIVTSHWSGRFADALRRLVDEERPDLVICEWSPYAIFLRDLDGPPSIIVAHNIESYIWARYEENEANPFRRWYIGIQRRKVEAFERKCFHWSQGATAVSSAEAGDIEAFGVPYRVETVENGVDVDFFTPTPDPTDPASMIFSGAMDWRPNQDAVEYMVHEVLPRVRSEVPEAEFRVVGRNPPRSILDLDRLDGVSITGTVDDVRPHLAAAEFCVVPLRIGGGSRLKILAAMAAGKAVISTSIGAEGLRVSDGENIILADGAEGLAAAIVSAFADRDRVRRVAATGRALVEEHYRWESLGQRLLDYARAVVARAET